MAFFYYQLYNKLHVLEQTSVVWVILWVNSNLIYKQKISLCVVCIAVIFKLSFSDMFIFDFRRHFSRNGYMSFTRTTSLFLRPAKLGHNRPVKILCGFPPSKELQLTLESVQTPLREQRGFLAVSHRFSRLCNLPEISFVRETVKRCSVRVAAN